MSASSFSKDELLRYSRHLLLPEVGIAGQERIKAARVLVVGAGGLGSPVILYLVAAGIGTIGVVDFDQVDLSNLQRQIIYSSDDVDASKVERAAIKARALNPQVKIEKHEMQLSGENILDLFAGYDLVIDGTDNFATRYLINDACVMLKKPNVYGAIYRFEGQASVFALKDGGPCYRCLFPEPPTADAVPNCAEGGVLGVMAGVIGCIQATEALKIVIGIGESLAGRLLIYDALSMKFETLAISKDQNCPVCGNNPRIKDLGDISISCQSTEPSASINIVTPIDLQLELQNGNQITLLDVRTDREVALGKIANSKHIPLLDLPQCLNELNKSDDIVVYCKSGARSDNAMQLLFNEGFQKVRSLKGGIVAWSRDVDSSLNVY